MTKFAKITLGVFAFVAVFAASKAFAYSFNTNLSMGMTNADVVTLQQFLNGHGHQVSMTGVGSSGMETMYFGSKTKMALASFQAAKGITPAVGYFGPITRSTINDMDVTGGVGSYPAGCMSTSGFSTTTGMSCASTSTMPAGCTAGAMYSSTTGMSCTGGSTPTTSPTGPLSGTVGTIDYALTSGLSNEEVGEDSNDVKVAGLELDLEDSDSDVSVTAIKLNFDVGTAGNDFEDYADEVSVWLGSTKVATVDADEFNDDNDFEKTVTLSNAVVRMGETKDLYVAVSGVSNLDTSDVSDTWTVDFTLVRFVDAQGATTSEDPTEAPVTFSFESFATANDIIMKITEGDEDINDAHVINVDATDDTDNVELLSFNIEADGDSDIVIDALPITITTVEATGNDPDDLISTVYLFAGNTEIGSENLSTVDADGGTEVVVFDDLDYTIDANEEIEFTIKAKLYSIADSLDAGDTIQVTFGEVETDLATFEVEDESGEELVDTDKTGTVTGDAHAVYDVGFTLEYVSSSETKTVTSETATVGDQGQFVIKYKITAFDGDIYIDNTCTEDNDGGEVATTTSYSITNNGSNTTSCVMTEAGTVTNADSANTFRIIEGSSREFTLTVNGIATVDAFAAVSLEAIGWDVAIGGDNNVFGFDLPGDYDTDPLFLNMF